jgi:hypothetical protein
MTSFLQIFSAFCIFRAGFLIDLLLELYTEAIYSSEISIEFHRITERYILQV